MLEAPVEAEEAIPEQSISADTPSDIPENNAPEQTTGTQKARQT